MKTRIMLVDDSSEQLQELNSAINSRDDLQVVATASGGEQALNMFNEFKPDVLVLDLVMPDCDGFEVLEKIHKGDCKILVLSALTLDAFITKAINLGADYYMRKPCNAQNVVKRILDLVNSTDDKKPSRVIKNRTLEEKITNVFITVGIPAHIKGYQFLREAIKLAIDDPEVINSITKKLYPEVAEKFDTSPSKVERAIRHAIEVAWNRGKIENINSLFGVRVYNHNEKPTNGEFIALVADKMLLESV